MSEITTAGLLWLAISNAASWLGLVAVSWIGFRVICRQIRQNEALTEQVVQLKAAVGWQMGYQSSPTTGAQREWQRATAGEPPDDHEEPI